MRRPMPSPVEPPAQPSPPAAATTSAGYSAAASATSLSAIAGRIGGPVPCALASPRLSSKGPVAWFSAVVAVVNSNSGIKQVVRAIMKTRYAVDAEAPREMMSQSRWAVRRAVVDVKPLELLASPNSLKPGSRLNLNCQRSLPTGWMHIPSIGVIERFWWTRLLPSVLRGANPRDSRGFVSALTWASCVREPLGERERDNSLLALHAWRLGGIRWYRE